MARRPAVRHRVIVLGRTKLGEQDLIVTMLTSEGSQLRAVAKGARKPASRLAARSELFTEADVLVVPGRSLGIVTEAEIINLHMGARGDVERVAAACAMCEVARLTSFEDVQDPFMFGLLSRSLLACEQAKDRAHLDLCMAAYVLKAMSHAGWRPVLDSCVACGEPSRGRLCVRAGGVLCESCARDVEDAFPIVDNTVAWLEALVGLTFDDLLSSSIDVQTAANLLDIAHKWGTTHLDARLRATEFLQSTY